MDNRELRQLAENIKHADAFDALEKSREIARSAATPAPVETASVVTSEPAEILMQNLSLIERLAHAIGRRRGLDSIEIEEFLGELKLRLVQNNYAIIREFRARSSFATYIAAVITQLMLTYQRNAARTDRYVASDREVADDHASLLERADVAAKISATLRQFIARLPEDDQIILKLRFETDMTVSQIARALHLEQASLYRRFSVLFRSLRGDLIHAGVTSRDVGDVVGIDSDLVEAQLDDLGAQLATRGPRIDNDEPTLKRMT